jgi:cytochrome b561
MVARAEGSLHRFAHANSPERMLSALYGCAVLITVAIGVLGLHGDARLKQVLESGINIHVLFGLLLCGLVLARCRWRMAHSPHMPPHEIRELSRHLSRIVYLLLYVVIGSREVVGVLNSLWNRGPVDFNLFDARFRPGPDYAGFDPKDDFQMFLVTGLVALLFVRALAFALRSHKRPGERAEENDHQR